jgi:hypothetical protein
MLVHTEMDQCRSRDFHEYSHEFGGLAWLALLFELGTGFGVGFLPEWLRFNGDWLWFRGFLPGTAVRVEKPSIGNLERFALIV